MKTCKFVFSSNPSSLSSFPNHPFTLFPPLTSNTKLQQLTSFPSLVPLSWNLGFRTPETKSLHLLSLHPHLKTKITWDRKKDYFITFAAEHEENQWLEIVDKVNGGLAVRPLREYLVNDGEMWDVETGDWKVLEHWQRYW